MKYFLLSLSIIVLTVACSSNQKKVEQEKEPVISSEKETKKKIDSINEPPLEIESDCVFDTSTYKFTSEILLKFDRKIHFSWDKNNQQAIVKFPKGDSLLVHIGGCYHFGYSAEYRTNEEAFSNPDYLMAKTKWLAKNFLDNGFDTNYLRFISSKQYVLQKDESDWKVYSVKIDSLIAENEIYDGFDFKRVGKRTHISISGYIN
ncbi:hypothetical protein [Fluviicola taffensis]|uniref:hypothetical protein n=1 Tax=Fluviicola taffensis TaxID=191579 RepID=UPI003137DFD2